MINSPASVTVIIVNWNSGDLLAECIRHLNSQSVKPETILVIDNASSDGSVEKAEASGTLITLRMKENLGFAAGNNRGLAESKTEFVALLNADAYAEPDWLENLLSAARLHQGVSAFGSKQLCQSNPDILDGVGDRYHISGLIWREGHGHAVKANDIIPREIFSPCACAALYRRQALLDIGGFDEDYFCYAEDVDLGFRLRLAGHKAMYVPDAVVHHVGSATTGGQHSDFSVYHGHRNLVWTFVKNVPGMLFWVLLPVHLLLNIVTVCFFIGLGQGRVICRAKLDAIKGLATVWEKRKMIQTNRVVGIRDIWRVLARTIIPRK